MQDELDDAVLTGPGEHSGNGRPGKVHALADVFDLQPLYVVELCGVGNAAPLLIREISGVCCIAMSSRINRIHRHRVPPHFRAGVCAAWL